ncbi:MAG: serine hydrolase [Actinomycetota bacterium]
MHRTTRTGGRAGIGATRLLRLVAFLLLGAAFASACRSGVDEVGLDESSASDLAADAAPSSTQAPSTTRAPTTTGAPEAMRSTVGPALDQADWFVAALNDGAFPVDDIEQRFSPFFLAQVPAEQLTAVVPSILALAEAPFSFERFDSSADGLSGEGVLIGADGQQLALQIVVEADAPHRIDGLLVSPIETTFPFEVTIEEIDQQLTNLGPESSVGLYDVSDGDCRAVHEVRTDSPIVLGSTFKLWVLAALAHEIDEGRASWDETMLVTDELRSSPDGEIFALETGTEVTLRRLAAVMISISDNTATDHLIDRLGREAIEQTIERIGIADPSANSPLLSTSNLFALKFIADPPNSDDYRALDEAGRRALLAELDRQVLPWANGDVSPTELAAGTNADGVSITEPRDLDLEWFATARDLCLTLVYLSQLADTPGLEPVADALEINSGPGIPFDRERWPTIRFKGGSEPGVIAGAWWFEGSDQDRYVVAGGVANPDAPIADLDAIITIASAIDLVD